MDTLRPGVLQSHTCAHAPPEGFACLRETDQQPRRRAVDVRNDVAPVRMRTRYRVHDRIRRHLQRHARTQMRRVHVSPEHFSPSADVAGRRIIGSAFEDSLGRARRRVCGCMLVYWCAHLCACRLRRWTVRARNCAGVCARARVCLRVSPVDKAQHRRRQRCFACVCCMLLAGEGVRHVARVGQRL